MKKREYKSLSEANAIACKIVKRRFSKFLTFCAGYIGFSCLFGYLAQYELNQIASYIFGCIGVVLLVSYGFWLYKEKLVMELAGPRWKTNSGCQPVCDRVNVQKTDGTVVWNISPSELNWSLDIDNPIKEYNIKA